MLKNNFTNAKMRLIIVRSLIFASLLFWVILTLLPAKRILENDPPYLYSSECEDRLFQIFIGAIARAKEEIHLVIYALNDSKVIRALNKASQRGIVIKVIYDHKTDSQELTALSKEIKKIPTRGSALMHRKILIIDRDELYIGSANFTPPSLRLHYNLVIGMRSKQLSERIIDPTLPPTSIEVGGQYIEFYTFPEDRQVGVPRLLELIDSARDSLVIGMFTWTYAPLTEAIIKAHRRGVKVTAILDQQSAYGASNKTLIALLEAGIEVKIGPGGKLFHHKFLYIDQQKLATGSSNWTKAAFSRNQDCLLILHHLTTKQRKKMARMIKIIRCTTFSAHKEDLVVLR